MAAGAWGKSWGKSWAGAWGYKAEAVPPVRRGGDDAPAPPQVYWQPIDRAKRRRREEEAVILALLGIR